MNYGTVLRVASGSLGEELGLLPGDKIVSVNGEPLRDIIDFSFAMAEEEIDLLVERTDGERELLSFDKEFDEELGVEFASAVFNGIRSCANHCLFCFVDQVAPDMRESLYVKDDDYRLSFLYGNFITMTNMGERDFRRISAYHLSPLFVSVHTTDMELRKKLLGTPRAAELMEQLDRLDAAGTEYHAQVVLCPGLNDGETLDKTIADMMARRPQALSLAIVPVGLTRFRENCYPLSPFDQAGAARIIEQVEKWQEKSRAKSGENFVYLADEFYLQAGVPLPEEEEYDGFPQLDNGVGLARSFIEEWNEAARDKTAGYKQPFSVTVVCGVSIAPVFHELVDALALPNLTVRILPVENRWFGSSVTVSGLLTGADMLAALSCGKTTDAVILPRSALRSGENVFLDDMTLAAFFEKCGREVRTALSGGELYRLLAHWYDAPKDEMGEQAYMWQSNAAYTKLEGERA
ncbi:MAG: DUF512 domain-containing protein [Schwartzia sp.]|nr:DUF512 domain-containing protein [Schwartzia sp. (in: firmicutes)]